MLLLSDFKVTESFWYNGLQLGFIMFSEQVLRTDEVPECDEPVVVDGFVELYRWQVRLQ
jgi:hypothetical protein